jgi:hypothetical protein
MSSALCGLRCSYHLHAYGHCLQGLHACVTGCCIVGCLQGGDMYGATAGAIKPEHMTNEVLLVAAAAREGGGIGWSYRARLRHPEH